MKRIYPSGWTRQLFIRFYSEFWQCPTLPLGPDKKPKVRSWAQYQDIMPTQADLDRCLNSWGTTLLLKHGLFCLDFDEPEAFNLFKNRIPAGACIAKTPRGYHIVLRSSSPTDTIKGGNQQFIACLERIDPMLVEVDADGKKWGKIDILGDNSLLHSPDSPGYEWLELYDEPITVNFAQFLHDLFGYTLLLPRISDFLKTGQQGGGAGWLNIFCPFCEFDGRRHDSPSCSIDLDGGGFKCHGSCGRQGKLTELIDHAREVNYPLPQAVYEWASRFKRQDEGMQASDSDYGPPQSLQQFLSTIEVKPQAISGLASRGELVMVFGITGIGKSSLLEYIIACACAGVNIADLFLVMQPLKCLFIDVQMAPAEVGLRFETLFNALGRGLENFSIKSYSDFDITKPEAQKWLYDTVKQGGYDVWAIDPFEDIHHLKENDTADMQRVVAPMRKVVNELNCVGLIGHHAGGDQYDNKGRLLPKKPRGATAITDRMDTVIELIGTENECEKLFHVRKQRKSLMPRQNDIVLKYDPETLLMSLGGPTAIVRAYREGAKDRYEILSTLLQIKAFGLTDKAIGEEVGVGRNTITRYVSGIRKPPEAVKAKLEELLKRLQEGGTSEVPRGTSQA